MKQEMIFLTLLASMLVGGTTYGQAEWPLQLGTVEVGGDDYRSLDFETVEGSITGSCPHSIWKVGKRRWQ
jgi:hypothetical protein